MTADAFIPVGRTSLARKGSTPLQVQTEYAARPYPRITTTVLNSGQVVHKVERRLERAVTTMEERGKAEAVMQQQHSEIVALIEDRSGDAGPSDAAIVSDRPAGAGVLDKLSALPRFRRCYRLNVDGVFIGATTARAFKKAFRRVNKSLHEIIELFPFLPGGMGLRQTGVCEIIRDRLYFVSTGVECLFVEVEPGDGGFDYEAGLREVLIPAE